MNLYAHQDLSLFDFADYAHPLISNVDNYYDDDDFYYQPTATTSAPPPPKSPPRHRHDGTSPLPLGMDWSSPPRKWDGRNSVWPHDPHTGWSYCVTVPSWILYPSSRGSEPVAFYRVQVGIQSPEGITSTRGILKRYSDFLSLLSELKKAFPHKHLPQAPPKRILKMRNKTMLEERRCSLEDWLEKLLSDIDISRSVTVATFLELEAAARAACHDQETSESHPVILFQTNSNVSVIAASSSVASDRGNDTPDQLSELGTPRHQLNSSHDLGSECSTSQQDINNPTVFNRNTVRHKVVFGKEASAAGREKFTEDVSKPNFVNGDGTEILQETEYLRLDGHVRRLSSESVGSELSSTRASEVSNFGMSNLFGDSTLDRADGLEASKTLDASLFSKDSLVVLPSDQRLKLNRVLNTMRQRLTIAKTDMEDVIARLNQEIAVREFLTMKVKDLEVELETTRENCKDNIQQAVLTEKERFTQMQWDMEELRKQLLETDLQLKYEQAERARAESSKISLLEENNILLHDLENTRDQLESLHKHFEEAEVKSKADIKLLVKEVKTLRGSQSDLKQELGHLMKEKLEVERNLLKERQRIEHADSANSKLLHECEILRSRLQECSVNFLSEEEDKLDLDTSSPSDALDLLATSDNRIGLLLAEAQLLAQDIEKSAGGTDETSSINGKDQRSDDELRRIVTDIFVDNARLRMHVNSVIRCALNTCVKSDEEDEEEDETHLRKTVLSKFLER